jgi:acetylornithine/N-succinyldiaminopimelate aminotransferase
MTDYAERYAAVMMNAFGPPRRVFVSGEGCYLVDDKGRRYLDLLGGLAVNALGHAHPAIVETITRQAATLGHVSNFFATPPQIALAERLLEILDCGDGTVFLTNSGTEAVEAGLKLTRLTGRPRIVVAEGSFHGRTMGALSLTSKASYREPFLPLLPGVTFVPYGDQAALDAAVDDETAAILLEPIQGEAGVVVPPTGYLSKARTIADQHGALLWLDEVQTGIGRTGTWFAFQQEGVRPDIVTIAKGLGAGFPIGACVALGAAPSFQPGQHGSTFGGNPLAAAVALTVLTVISSDDLLDQAKATGEELTAMLAGLPGVRGVRGKGLLLAAVLDDPAAGAIARAALDNGVIVNDCQPDVVRLAPPLIIDQPELDVARERLTAAWAHRASSTALAKTFGARP